MAGARPRRPKSIRGSAIFDTIWHVTERCWNYIPDQRPVAHEIVKDLEQTGNPSGDQPPFDLSAIRLHVGQPASGDQVTLLSDFKELLDATEVALAQANGYFFYGAADAEAIRIHRSITTLRLGDVDAKEPLRTLVSDVRDLSRRLRSFEPRDVSANTLDAIIAVHRMMLSFHPAGHRTRADILEELALSLRNRFVRRLRRGDLEESVGLLREVLRLRPRSDPIRSTSLREMADTLFLHSYGRRRNTVDLDEAIKYYRELVGFRTMNDHEQADAHGRLAEAYHERYKLFGDVKALKQVIVHFAHELTYDPAAAAVVRRPELRTELATALRDSFRRVGNVSELDEAIAHFRDLVGLGLEDRKPDCERSLNDLGFCLMRRYAISGNATALELSALLTSRTSPILSRGGQTRIQQSPETSVQASYIHRLEERRQAPHRLGLTQTGYLTGQDDESAVRRPLGPRSRNLWPPWSPGFIEP
jgi:tetratricopeptide (TPR) repeat protein